ncbi:MAG: M3 family oligoendopeptidase [Oscillospiraceae bacterium]|nr:M3 family oligoendopeptidase [Oscillospiraceae bacterium]
MNGKWNLEVIYKGFDDPAWLQDFENLQNMLRDFCAFAETVEASDPKSALPECIKRREEAESLIMKMATYANLRQSQDTRDGDAGSQMGRLMAAYSTVAAPLAKVEKWISEIPNLEELIAGDPALKPYEFMLKNTVRDCKYLLPGRGEEIMARMKLSGGSAWSDLQSYLTATVPVTYRGEKTNLSTIRNLAYDPDGAVRKEAYEAEIAAYDRIRDAVAFALNSIKLETISDCKLRSYVSPLDRTLSRSYMEKETLQAMLSAMDDYLPKFWQYLKAKAKALGYEKGLPWYELFAPMGKSSTKFTAEEARDYLVSLYGGFDGELAAMVAEAFDNDWIDFYPREGKVGGAFCAGVDAIGQSRILTNFDGSFSDVVTLAHELGHAFHNLCIRDHRPLNKDYSMPVAETASTFNECVVMASAIEKAADKEEKLALIESQLQDATQIICDIYSRYRFETMVFEKREERFMDADTLCGFMLDAQRQSYGDGLDPDCQHPYMWVCKSHYYGPTFYNFPYAFGGLFARGLYAQYEKEGDSFIPKYKKLLYTTPIATAEETAKVADIDLTDKQFWAAALQQIADQIDLFCELVED